MADPRTHRPELWPPHDGPYRQTAGPSPAPTTAQTEVARLETTLLSQVPSAPAPLIVPLPAPSFPSTPPSPMPEDVHHLRTALLPLARETARETEAEIATLERSAQHARAEATELAGPLDALTEALSRVMTRRRALVGRADLTLSEAGELAELEHTVSDCSQHLADLWLQWTTLVVQAHDHEQRARHLRSRGE
jgi:hypothetical protein